MSDALPLPPLIRHAGETAKIVTEKQDVRLARNAAEICALRTRLTPMAREIALRIIDEINVVLRDPSETNGVNTAWTVRTKCDIPVDVNDTKKFEFSSRFLTGMISDIVAPHMHTFGYFVEFVIPKIYNDSVLTTVVTLQYRD